MKSEFKLSNRGFDKTLLLIPGWATDYRIFSRLDLDYNYILPTKFYPFVFKKELSEFLDKASLNKISLFGWSLGGFLAAHFCADNPERIEELFLVSTRKKFDPLVLKDIALKLKENREAYLYKFYQDCFSAGDTEGWRVFRRDFLKIYLNEIKLLDLLDGLNYLAQAQMPISSLASLKKINILHGKEDKICPFKEAEDIQHDITKAKLISFPDAGHILFLSKNFINSVGEVFPPLAGSRPKP